MPEDMSDRVPEDMPDRMPEDLPDRMPEDMPEDMPDHMPEDMPDRMPNRMSEDMSDRMPEDLPVRKCINVMVGITRSKVIFFSWMKKFTTLNKQDKELQKSFGHLSIFNDGLLEVATSSVTKGDSQFTLNLWCRHIHGHEIRRNGRTNPSYIPDWLLLMALDNNPSRQGVACPPPHTLLRGRVSGEHIRTGDHVGRTSFFKKYF